MRDHIIDSRIRDRLRTAAQQPTVKESQEPARMATTDAGEGDESHTDTSHADTGHIDSGHIDSGRTENAAGGPHHQHRSWQHSLRQSPPPCLTIYVVDHCELCAYALQMADWIRRQYPHVDLRVVNIGHATEPIPESVFAAPTYLLNGKVWSLGNPSEAQVHAALASPNA